MQAVGDAEAVTGDEIAAVAAGSYRAPTRSPRLIAREALLARLVDQTSEQLIVVSAPAGYGKTTTMALWDAADPCDFAWVHLDVTDDDPVHLLRHIARGLHEVEPVDPSVLRVLSGGGRSIDLDMLPALGWALHERRPFVLVLDDVHCLRSPASLRCVESLLGYLPAGGRLALVGRGVPSIDLARRRMSGQLLEITAGDLAMDDAEAAALLDKAGLTVDLDTVHALVEQTEGWAGGLHLAALALAHRDANARATAFSGRDRLVADYLVEEVLAVSSPAIQQFLLRSSVLDRMSASLLDELLETNDAGQLLAEIERSGNLFLVPLDREREWFRYHHLFGEMLLARLRTLDPDLADALHARASAISERQGDIDGAVRHAVAARDGSRAADLVLRYGVKLVYDGRVALLGQWLELLGAEAWEQIPAAVVASAWYSVATGDFARLIEAMQAADRIGHAGPLSDGSPSLEVAMAMLRAVAAGQGLSGVLADTEIVRAGGGADTNPWWGLATGVRGTACSMLGHLDEARALLLDACPALTLAPTFEAGALAHLALLDLYADDLAGAEAFNRKALALADRHRLEGVVPAIPVFVIGALVTARTGRVEEAKRLTATARSMLIRLGDLAPRTAVLGYLLLAKTALALGDPTGARSLAQEAQRARQRDGSATYLVEQLDALHEQLASAAVTGNVAISPLTAAELRVLPYLATHLSLQEIAEALIISRNTAKSHSVAIYRKLGVSSRSDAVTEARRLGLIADPTTTTPY